MEDLGEKQEFGVMEILWFEPPESTSKVRVEGMCGSGSRSGVTPGNVSKHLGAGALWDLSLA